MAGVGTRGALRSGISRRGGVLHLWRDPGGLDGVHKANRRNGGQAVLLFLRCCPLRAKAAEQGGMCLSQRLYATNCRVLPLEKVPVCPRFLVRCWLSILAGWNQEEQSVWRAAKGRRGVAPAEIFAGRQVFGFGAGASRRQDCSRARCLARCSCSFSARAWRVARRRGSGAATTRIRFQEISRPSLDRNTLARAISISSPASLPAPTGGSQKVVLPNLSAHPSRSLSSPCVAHTQQVSSSSQRNTTLGADVAWERLYPRTSHLRPLGMSSTLSVWVRRMALTALHICCDFSLYPLYPAASWERHSSSSARHRCSSSYCHCSASS